MIYVLKYVLLLTLFELLFCGNDMIVIKCKSETSYQYEFTGIIDYNSKGSINHFSHNFHLAIRNDQWFARLEPRSRQPYVFKEIGCDGTNTYSLLWMGDNANVSVGVMPEMLRSHKITNINKIIPINKGTGSINKGKISYNSIFHDVNILLLSYHARLFTNALTSNVLPKVYISGASYYVYPDGKPLMQKVLINQSPDGSGVIDAVIYFDDGYERDISNPDNKRPRKIPFQNGFTNAIYHVNEKTNAFSHIYPLNASLSVFGPSKDAHNSNDISLYSKYDIILQNVKTNITVTATATLFKPGIDDMVFFDDKRFGSKTVQYLAKSWLTPEKVKKIPQYDKEYGQSKISLQWFIIIIMVMTFLFPLMYYISVKVKIRRNNKYTL